jgi:hypothetical protein
MPNMKSSSVIFNPSSAQSYNYSTTAGDGYAVRASDTTITFTGPTLTSSQLRGVIVDTGSAVNVYEQGKNGIRLSISSSTITVSGAGVTPIPAGSTVDAHFYNFMHFAGAMTPAEAIGLGLIDP